jgi:hypothetical protein
LRFDVNGTDKFAAGATVVLTAQRVSVSTTDPYHSYTFTEITDITDAQTAQGITPISLASPSSTIVWLSKIDALSGTISGTATGTVVTGTVDSGTGYVKPLYVEPEFWTDSNGVVHRFETGGLLLGIKIVSLPTTVAPNTAPIAIWDILNDFYLTTRVVGFDCPNFS